MRVWFKTSLVSTLYLFLRSTYFSGSDFGTLEFVFLSPHSWSSMGEMDGYEGFSRRGIMGRGEDVLVKG